MTATGEAGPRGHGHLVVYVSAHGYGHIGQTAPVVNAVCRRHPGLQLTIVSAAPEHKLRERFEAPFTLVPTAADVGMIQADAATIEHDRTADAYAALHDRWADTVAGHGHWLRGLAPDLVVANAAYLPLAAAAQAGIDALGLCSINWAEIYGYYYAGERPEAGDVLEQMLAAYNAAPLILKPEPAMGFEAIGNTRPIGPIAQRPRGRRQALREHGGFGDRTVVMVSLGGMVSSLDFSGWPARADVLYIVPDEWQGGRPDMLRFSSLGLPYLEALNACDAAIVKPGYGSFVEAACLGMPLLYLPRPGWPELPYLESWLSAHARCRAITARTLAEGDLLAEIDAVRAMPPPGPPPEPTGVDEAAACIGERLRA